MASIEIGATSWRRVEVGRVLKLENGGLATIVEIIDHKRVCGTRPTFPPYSEGLWNMCVRTG
jgi:large subunit ribosomal protein L14e